MDVLHFQRHLMRYHTKIMVDVTLFFSPISINDLDEDIDLMVVKFVDDSNVYRKVCCEEDVRKQQKDIHRLIE